MTNEELNTKLYEKLSAEQEHFKDWLLGQSPQEILNHAYEYAVREDIVFGMECLNLSDDQANALLASKTPLADIYRAFEKIETAHMDNIRDCIENRADDEIKRQREELRDTPLYPFPAAYAREHDELEQYRSSHHANIACKHAIEDAISANYRDNRLDPAGAREIIDRFGMERTCFVLAATVQNKDWDGRISAENKSWAKGISIPADRNAWGGERSHEYVVDKVHPGLTDLFVKQVRKEAELLKERRPSVLKKLKEAAQTEAAPRTPKKHKEAER